MGHVQDNAEESVRRVLDVLKDGAFAYEMDDGSEDRGRDHDRPQARTATIDFTGTAPQRPTNFNAPSAVCSCGRALCLPHAWSTTIFR